MKLEMTVEEALDYAEEWTKPGGFMGGQADWRVVCAVMAEEVRRQRKSGHCGSCRFRDDEGYCNHEKLEQGTYWKHLEHEAADKLIFSYDEGGDFYVGPQFGCVHYVKKEEL